eukprot:GILJ01004404.1.p1 GENE.GILJ01004404.1~~GILJ01004404.1.p1  ORF type:complete len:321 (-),score=25.40 GILJ01004404.1:70-933(-)
MNLQHTLRQFAHTISDKDKLAEIVRRRKEGIKYWLGFAAIIAFAFYFFSDGDFSFLLTLAGAIQCFGFFIIFFKVRSQKSCSGVSLKTLQLYGIVFVSRLFSILRYEGYLPYDRSGDWFYQLVEILSLCFTCASIYLVRKPYRATYNKELDTFSDLVLIAPAFILACFLHPSLNAFAPADIAWTFALYLESVTILPQLFMFQKKGGEIEAFTTHFVAAQGLSRFLNFVFWMFSYHELNDKSSLGSAYVGNFVILAQVIQLVLMADFYYHYIRSLRRGIPMTLPAQMV